MQSSVKSCLKPATMKLSVNCRETVQRQEYVTVVYLLAEEEAFMQSMDCAGICSASLLLKESCLVLKKQVGNSACKSLSKVFVHFRK